jgi:hypothetical protein
MLPVIGDAPVSKHVSKQPGRQASRQRADCLDQRVKKMRMAGGRQILQELNHDCACNGEHKYCNPLPRIGQGKQSGHYGESQRTIDIDRQNVLWTQSDRRDRDKYDERQGTPRADFEKCRSHRWSVAEIVRRVTRNDTTAPSGTGLLARTPGPTTRFMNYA